MTRAWLAILIALAFAPEGRADLPPGYGGTIRVIAPEPLRVPDPTQVGSLFEATVADAVFDPLERLLDGEPSLTEDGQLELTLKQGMRRHDRRPLRANDLAIHLRRLARRGPSWWLAPLAVDHGRPAIEVVDDHTLRLRPAVEGTDLRPLLALRPLAYRAAVGTGTGPYRPRMVGDELRLFQFRSALRGAPYLRDWRFLPPRPRDDDLRALVLGEADGSFSGDSLHGRRPERATAPHPFPEIAPVLLVPNPHRVSDQWRALVGALRRDRLARVGFRPSDTLAGGLPSPQVGPPRRALSGELTLLVREGDRLGEELGRALAALVDEQGARLRIESVPVDRWADAIHRGRWHLRVAEVPPPLPVAHPLARVALLAAAHAATGDQTRARAVWTAGVAGTLDEAGEQRSALALGAAVLGRRRLELHLDQEVRDVRFDAAGRLRLGDAHLPRARTETP
ncbi:MAG: hypothetical protein JJ863_02680 [Deltaproteobacteria bacterium]|nr:hypothetical protein [Deltaproteobacteria bacterium]